MALIRTVVNDGHLLVLTLGRYRDQHERLKNWSLGLLLADGSHEDPETTATLLWLLTLAKRNGVRTIYAPLAGTFNQKICLPADLGEIFPLQSGTFSYDIRRGREAEGTPVPRGTAFFCVSADCPHIVVSSPSGLVIAAHAGRDSLINRTSLLKTGKNTSVVDNIMRFVREPATLKVWTMCGIAAKYFEHPWNHQEYGFENEVMSRYAASLSPSCIVGEPAEGKLSLYEIIKAQFLQYGVRVENIHTDNVDTHSDRGRDNEYRWWSHRRGDKERNGVFVFNRNI